MSDPPPGASRLTNRERATLPEKLRRKSAARSASTTGVARFTRPTVRITARRRSASSFPKSVDDVVATVATAREYGAPITGRGCGTSLAGQCCNTSIIIDMSKYLNQRARDRSVERSSAASSPARSSMICAMPRRSISSPSVPIPATHNHCTLGGMIGNNSCGIHSVMAAFQRHRRAHFR